MKTRVLPLLATLGLLILSTGCYTKLYNPNREDQGPYSTNTLYDRFDSTAIDTTLTKPDVVDVYPNNDYYGWSTWGRPRGYTRWGFDFDRFSPNYYWSYYGYYDYYSRPWWHDWNRGGHWWNGGGGGGISEPPSQRPGRRSSDAGVPPPIVGGGSYSPAPVYNQPSAPVVQPVQPVNPSEKTPPADAGQKRNGKRIR
ncbi:MAG: hypothetical protein IPG71_01230 [bacterium]|nr:hypothetical protein [bacterium]